MVPKADRKDMSREALKRHWDSKKGNSVGIISCQPGGSSESTVIVAEKTLNGLTNGETGMFLTFRNRGKAYIDLLIP